MVTFVGITARPCGWMKAGFLQARWRIVLQDKHNRDGELKRTSNPHNTSGRKIAIGVPTVLARKTIATAITIVIDRITA